MARAALDGRKREHREQDAADNWKPSKKKSIERIDGIVALIMALDRASTQPPPERSVYEERGFLWV